MDCISSHAWTSRALLVTLRIGIGVGTVMLAALTFLFALVGMFLKAQDESKPPQDYSDISAQPCSHGPMLVSEGTRDDSALDLAMYSQECMPST